MRYEDDGFDPTPYDRILSGIHTSKNSATANAEDINAYKTARQNGEMRQDSLSQIDDINGEAVVPSEENITEAFSVAEEINASDETEMLENMEEEAYAADADAESGYVEMNDNSLSQIDDEKHETVEEADVMLNENPDIADEQPENTELEAGNVSAPVSAPAAAPEFAPQNEEKEVAAKISLENLLIANELNFTEIRDGESTRVYIEEDILVPDIKPDMAKILSMDGSVKCADKEIKSGQKGEDRIKVTGDITLETIYIPEKPAAEPIVTIQSRIPFRTDWGINTAPFSSAVIKPVIESVDYMVINERKFRAKLTVVLTMREYAGKYIELFEGIRGEDIEVLKEKVSVTDILAKKKDVLDVEENLLLKENSPMPGRILKYGINVVENHKQISPEKAVINGTVYCNILYLAESQEDDIIETSMEAEDFMDETSETGSIASVSAAIPEPAFYQGKIEFTQFIPLDIDDTHSGSRITFDGSDLSVRIKNFSEDDEEAGGIGFAVEGSINTNIEIYKNVEAEIVTDVYHNERELEYDSEPFTAKAIAGSGVTELSAREILNIPPQYSDIEQVIYISGKVQNVECTAENGKETVSGTIDAELLAIAADEDKTPFKMQHSLPFRGSMDIAGSKAGMIAESDIYVKELWFDKINNKQIEVNAGILALGTVSGHETCSLIKNPVFIQNEDEGKRKASMIIYISRPQDDLWKIAKKFRTTRERISRINGLDPDKAISEGTKLLIIK
ncbi:MAG: DUF3794 domain-containing protein [Firmicutes bacterium]|nr:DUF3794 domain-containing protein [Bacillota bacterium]